MGRHSENYVEVVDIQQVFPLPVDPLLFRQCLALGAMAVAAGVVGNSDEAAMAAGIQMSSKSGGSATAYGTEGFGLDRGERMSFSILSPKLPENILNLNHLCAAWNPPGL